MGDHPASDPAKPGSKLASIQKLGRRGGIRTGDGRTPEEAAATRAGGGPEPVTGAPVPQSNVKRPTRKAVKRKAKSVTRAKAVLKKAEGKTKAKAKATKAKRVLVRDTDGETLISRKPGPPAKVGTPWKEAGVSKSKYYRDLRAKSE
jgi:hypothetical protein